MQILRLSYYGMESFINPTMHALTKLKYTFSILPVYLKYTSSILQPIELQKKKYTSSLYHFDKRSTCEAHFVKLNQYF